MNCLRIIKSFLKLDFWLRKNCFKDITLIVLTSSVDGFFVCIQNFYNTEFSYSNDYTNRTLLLNFVIQSLEQ